MATKELTAQEIADQKTPAEIAQAVDVLADSARYASPYNARRFKRLIAVHMQAKAIQDRA